MSGETTTGITVAEEYLAWLWSRGIDTLFLNAGTDFAPLIEAYARNERVGGRRLPRPVLATHENLVAGMAHGAYLVTGRPQAVMFHVSVGTANAVCAVTNAARDNVPMLVTAGRSPILEWGASGARDTSIHWAQEMFDQAGMVRELVKWDYELRDPRQVRSVVDRALGLASSDPKGPVYLSLPREVLAEQYDDGFEPPGATAVPAGAHPDPRAVATLADRIATATLPVIVASASGADPSTVAPLAELCDRFGIGVVELQPRYMNLPADHPCHLGYDTGRIFGEADVLCFLDCDVPWMAAKGEPRPDAFIAQVGVDPLFARYPMRTHRSDLSIATGAAALLEALAAALTERAGRIDPARRDAIGHRADSHRAATGRARAREQAAEGAVTKAFMSTVMAELLDDEAVVFNEYWALPELLGRRRPGSYFYLPPAGGLGWSVPAALGAKYAEPARTVVAAVGDGAYLFANPAACHHAAQKHGLPILIIVANNSCWGAVEHATRVVYPEGEAVRGHEDRLSNLSPSPAFERYAEASGGLGEHVTSRDGLRPALARALHAVRVEGRQALLNVQCA